MSDVSKKDAYWEDTGELGGLKGQLESQTDPRVSIADIAQQACLE